MPALPGHAAAGHNVVCGADSFLSSDLVAHMSTNSKGTEIAAAGVSGQAQRLSLFGPRLLLEGEDGAAYDELVGRICAAVRPADVIDEMFIADIVALEWEILRWRRLKLSLIRTRALQALQDFLHRTLDYDLYSGHFAERLTEILQDNVPEDRPEDFAQTLAHACARNESDAVDQVIEILGGIDRDIDAILDGARAHKAEELVQQYVRHESDVVTLVNQLLANAGESIDDLMADTLRNSSLLDYLERLDRLATIAESRRNASLREIDRRRAVLGETLRRSVREIEDDDFADGELVPELPPAEGKSAA